MLADALIGSVARSLPKLPEPLLSRLAGGLARSDRGDRIDPALAAMLHAQRLVGMKETADLDTEAARRELERGSALVAPPKRIVRVVEDRRIHGPAGPIAIRIYRPRGGTAPRSILTFFHGGGFVLGSLDSHDPVCRYLSARSQAIVVSVDYRLAPEHPYPAAVDDAEAAFRWVVEHAKELGGDPARVGVGGDSAGGNLSAVVSRRLRDAGGPIPAAQILIYPATDLTRSAESHRTFASGFFLDERTIEWFLDRYIDPGDARKQPDASPLFAADLSELPAAVVIAAGFDPLRDEGEAYAERLDEAGVDVLCRTEPTLIHGFISMAGASATAERALDAIARDVHRLLAP